MYILDGVKKLQIGSNGRSWCIFFSSCSCSWHLFLWNFGHCYIIVQVSPPVEIVLLSLCRNTIEQPLSACLSEIYPCVDVTLSAPICKGQRVLAPVPVGLICRLSGRLNDAQSRVQAIQSHGHVRQLPASSTTSRTQGPLWLWADWGLAVAERTSPLRSFLRYMPSR